MNTIEDFWKWVEKTSYCWNYTAKSGTDNGYGRFSYRGTVWLAHRFAWALYNELDTSLDVLHTCDNRRCVNPAHLYQGTNTDNIRDKVIRGRAQKGGPHNAGFHLSQRAFTIEQAEAILKRIELDDYTSFRALGREYGVSHHTISDLASRKYYREVDFVMGEV